MAWVFKKMQNFTEANIFLYAAIPSFVKRKPCVRHERAKEQRATYLSFAPWRYRRDILYHSSACCGRFA